jgi:putative transposase
MRYRRAYHAGGCYFFTVVTAERRPILAATERVELLRAAIQRVMRLHPFSIDAMVVLPDHLHCIWTLPEADADFSRRWRLIKTHFSRHAAVPLPCWQPRFWEHLIRDDNDYAHHVDYIHYNPVKHGYASGPGEWPYSSFGRFVARGQYSADWGQRAPDIPEDVGRE